MQDFEKNEILLAIQKLNVKMDIMQEQMKAIPEMQEQLKVIPQMQEDIHDISRAVARIEVVHGDKLSALFDAFTMHSEKIESHEKRIDECEKKIENQDNQIFYLKSKAVDI